jgi:NADPH:quinone reductase-like Zn-dependent oxidoreductase
LAPEQYYVLQYYLSDEPFHQLLLERIGWIFMKAIVCPRYGSPDVLQLQEIHKPVPKDDEALVKVVATSLNAADFETMRGTWAVRFTGPFRPLNKILGTDVAGTIEAVGRKVQNFRPGDEIWGDLSFPLRSGAFAEYVCIPEEALRLKPASMTFEEAAAIPTAAVVALQNLRAASKSSISPILSADGQIQAGQKTLINGAGGGVGTFAVQIAKLYGAEVTAVDSAPKLDMLRSLGADQVIDYTREDFTKSERRYDLVLDVVGSRSIRSYRRVLAPDGIFVLIGGSFGVIIQIFLFGPLLSTRGNKKTGIVPWGPNNGQDLAILAELFEAGQVVPVIDRRYPLNQLPEAMWYLEEGHAKGKVIIEVEQAGKTI